MLKCKDRAALLIQGHRDNPKRKEVYQHCVYLEPRVLARAIQLRLFVKRPRNYNTELSMSGWIEEQMIKAIREIEEKKRLADQSKNIVE